MRASVRAWRFATQTAPSPVARPTGSSSRPTGTVAVTTPRSGSTRVTVPLSGFATQTAPSPAATAPAPAPTSTLRSTEFVAGLTPISRPLSPTVHTLPSPHAIEALVAPSVIVRRRWLLGSMRRIVPAEAPGIHRSPSSRQTSDGLPAPIVSVTVFVRAET